MTVDVASPPRRIGRSILAVLAGFATVMILSTAVDAVLHALNVYPPNGQPMYEPGLNALALAYRCVFTVLGGYVCARLAPNLPLRHAFILGVIGATVGTAAVFATWNMGLGPHWYPIALAVTGLPLTWLGGALRVRSGK